ncbi:MlaE family ABC transporter permease [Spirochaetota bacterium]
MNEKDYILAKIGRRVIEAINFAGYTIVLLLKVIYYLKDIIKRRHDIAKQMYFAGVKTFSVISVVALFTGMVVALQTGLEMSEFNMQHRLGNVVIATLTREMGPFMSAIILIAAVGSAIAAEVGTMKVSEEIDALEMMSVSPVSYLVMPRVIALSIMAPIAAIYTNVLGTIGGAIVANSHLNIPFPSFYERVLQSLHFKAVYVGLFKSFIFGIIMSIISCAHGLKAENGALGVGKATRNSVVASFLMVLIIGYFITELFFNEGL